MKLLKKNKKNFTIILVAMMGTLFIMSITQNFIFNVLFLILFTFSMFAFSVFENETKLLQKTTLVILNYLFLYGLLLVEEFSISLYILIFVFPVLYVLQKEQKIMFSAVITNAFLFISIHFLFLLNREKFSQFSAFIQNDFLTNMLVFFIIHILMIATFNSRIRGDEQNRVELIRTKKSEEDLHLKILDKKNFSKNAIESVYAMKIYLNNQNIANKELLELNEKVKKRVTNKDNDFSVFEDFISSNNEQLRLLAKIAEQQENSIRKLQDGLTRIEMEEFDGFNKLENLNYLNASTIESLQEIINSVTNIQLYMDSIKAVSNQINLLSLNASIESSKLGETGKSFSIISKEIKHLQESVSDLINTVNSEIQSIQRSYNHSKDNFTVISKDTEFLISEQRDENKNTSDFKNELGNIHKVQKDIHSTLENLFNSQMELLKSDRSEKKEIDEIYQILEENFIKYSKNIQQSKMLISSLDKLNDNLKETFK